MTVSTHSRSASRPASACSARFLPSNLNGLVTTAIVSAPSSLARLAITGAAPVPVPPPRPVVTKIMSAPDSAWMIVSVSSSAACRPMFGIGAGAEALRQLVADLHLDAGLVVVERLHVGVGDDELDAAEADVHHAVDGVAAAAADADHLDLRAAPRLRDRASAAACSSLVAIGIRSCLIVEPPLEEFLENPAQPSGHAAERAGADRAGSGARLRCA